MEIKTEHKEVLSITLPLLREFYYGECCEDVRKESMVFAFKDLFEDMNISYTEGEDPFETYNRVRKGILESNDFNTVQKVKLLKLMQ